MCFLCSQCQQQGLDHTCGFFAAHNLMLAMGQANLTNPQVQLQIYIYVYLFITAQLLWSTWNALIPSCCHIYCCCQFLKLLLWSGTRWSCCCDLLLWPFCRLWLAYIYLLIIFCTAVVIYIYIYIYCHLLLCSFILWMMAIHMCNFILWLPFFVLEFWSAVH